MTPFSDAERRRRLVARHALGRTAADPVAAVKAVAAQHSSDPATPYLAAWARVPGFRTPDLDAELFEHRSLWRMHCMRGTLFVVPAEQAGDFEAACGRDLARRERERLRRSLAAEIGTASVDAWMESRAGEVLDALRQAELSTKELAAAVPELGREITLGSGKWFVRAPASSRLLPVMAIDGLILRTRPAGSWRSSQYRWSSVERWRGGPLSRTTVEEGRREVARRYLASHGPVTLTDLRWWTGWTAAAARKALKDLAAEPLDLEGGAQGWILAGDREPAEPPEPTVSFLPDLDSTPMGYKERDWYLPAEHHRLFDSNGNIGPTVWADGRAVGAWAQLPGGEVVYVLLEDLGTETELRVRQEAATLSGWLDGVVVSPRFPTPLVKELASGRNEE